MSEVRLWPQCAECSRKAAQESGNPDAWVPVEAYEMDDTEKPTRIVCRSRIRIIARCTHGQPHAKPQYQDAIIEVPMWWGKAHEMEAIRRLVFFAPGGGRPDHGLVTDL